MYGNAEDSVQPPSWRFIALWSSQPSYMPVRHGLSAIDMPNCSTTFTPVVFADFYGLSGRIKFRTQRSWDEPAFRASTPNCRKPNSGGHGIWCCVRMSDSGLPKQVFYGELSSGKRSAGGQKKRQPEGVRQRLWHMWQYVGNTCQEPLCLASRDYQWSSQCRGQTTGWSREETSCPKSPSRKYFYSRLRAHMSDLWERLSCSDRTPQPPPHSSPNQYFQLTKSRGHPRLRRMNIIGVAGWDQTLPLRRISSASDARHAVYPHPAPPISTIHWYNITQSSFG